MKLERGSVDYRNHFMQVIQKEVNEAIPVFAQNFALARMKHYGIDSRFLKQYFGLRNKDGPNS